MPPFAPAVLARAKRVSNLAVKAAARADRAAERAARVASKQERQISRQMARISRAAVRAAAEASNYKAPCKTGKIRGLRGRCHYPDASGRSKLLARGRRASKPCADGKRRNSFTNRCRKA